MDLVVGSIVEVVLMVFRVIVGVVFVVVVATLIVVVFVADGATMVVVVVVDGATMVVVVHSVFGASLVEVFGVIDGVDSWLLELHWLKLYYVLFYFNLSELLMDLRRG